MMECHSRGTVRDEHVGRLPKCPFQQLAVDGGDRFEWRALAQNAGVGVLVKLLGLVTP